MTDLHDKARALELALSESQPIVADVIANLLVEIERLKEGNRIFHLNAVADHERAKTAEGRYAALCEAEPVSWMNPSNGQTFDNRGRDRMIENGKHGGEFAIAARLAQQFSVALIPRPSMES